MTQLNQSEISIVSEIEISDIRKYVSSYCNKNLGIKHMKETLLEKLTNKKIIGHMKVILIDLIKSNKKYKKIIKEKDYFKLIIEDLITTKETNTDNVKTVDEILKDSIVENKKYTDIFQGVGLSLPNLNVLTTLGGEPVIVKGDHRVTSPLEVYEMNGLVM